ncbi:hypothetical protein GGS23DRAFT_206053 [Durotheca rogersii]|uniref:uncharacterized protein n=1 Tax=Durotheca rogersii TaxID=419775 RepID=UPI002220EA71|nr:uncharacterized protein GGS23DRAFT_206053 [Durotheca rogersii]KAI5861043.1 hypothetical protein GGS23DRAFT_206053 [Durotheca rogersii]
MTYKRKRTEGDTTCRLAASKRSRHTLSPDLLSPLSDELLLRVLSFLPLPDLLNTAPLSKRFYGLSGDSQIWRRLYYSRFVLPRALRIPGFRDGSARDGKLYYSSQRALWADGRRGGWVDMPADDTEKSSRNWKMQYKLRHNWARGKCAVEELHVGPEPPFAKTNSSHKMLVKVSEGIATTADRATGLRAWDLKTKELLAQINLEDVGSGALPSCIAIDEQKPRDKSLKIALGFTDGSFGVWQLDTQEKKLLPSYLHEKSSNGELVGIAFSYPYLLTATKSVLVSLYTFEGPSVEAPIELPGSDQSEQAPGTGSDEHTESRQGPGRFNPRAPESSRPKNLIRAPYILTSLKSHTSRAPLALSIRNTAGGVVASIAYTFSSLQGWSLGIQDLHLRSSASKSKPTPEIITTRLAYTLPVRTVPNRTLSLSASFSQPLNNSPLERGSNELDGPINLCYTHPYLLATLPDNTLILHLCKSTSSSLSISPGIRLWGHTSGISDAEITARGKAVSVSCRGEEIRVWELEGRAHGSSVEVRPTARPVADGGEGPDDVAVVAQAAATQWDDRRNWVGFDDEMVIVLKESKGRESLMVYDFT